MRTTDSKVVQCGTVPILRREESGDRGITVAGSPSQNPGSANAETGFNPRNLLSIFETLYVTRLRLSHGATWHDRETTQGERQR